MKSGSGHKGGARASKRLHTAGGKPASATCTHQRAANAPHHAAPRVVHCDVVAGLQPPRLRAPHPHVLHLLRVAGRRVLRVAGRRVLHVPRVPARVSVSGTGMAVNGVFIDRGHPRA